MAQKKGRKMRIILIIALTLGCLCARAEELFVPRFNQREPWTEYVIELLTTALNKAPGKTPDRVNWVEIHMNQDRAFAMLRSSKSLDVYWSMTSAAREQGVHTVRIPLMKGLLGVRLLIIRKDSIDKLSRVRTLNDLKSISIGQGLDWPDTAIMNAAGLRVVTSSSYDTLYRMLKAGRFDGIALGANEVDDELAKQNDSSFVIEKTITINYPAPVFFFVTPRKKELADRIEKGLQIMLEDGSFNAIFDKRWSKSLLANNLKGRRVIDLPNPLLSPKTAEMMRQHPEYFFVPPER